jgi:hypothetical protein
MQWMYYINRNRSTRKCTDLSFQWEKINIVTAGNESYATSPFDTRTDIITPLRDS